MVCAPGVLSFFSSSFVPSLTLVRSALRVGESSCSRFIRWRHLLSSSSLLYLVCWQCDTSSILLTHNITYISFLLFLIFRLLFFAKGPTQTLKELHTSGKRSLISSRSVGHHAILRYIRTLFFRSVLLSPRVYGLLRCLYVKYIYIYIYIYICGSARSAFNMPPPPPSLPAGPQCSVLQKDTLTRMPMTTHARTHTHTRIRARTYAHVRGKRRVMDSRHQRMKSF